MTCRFAACLSIVALCAAGAAQADPAPFDLAGPSIEVKVTRASATLPIAQVPNLAAGDQLWIKPDLPSSQSARYLLVAAFLRGSTNPPPPEWFFRCETWTKPCAQQGMSITVPAGAQQVLLFLAPHTTADLKTLRGAVRGRPGAFVRASQDLNQATLDRSRLERYLSALRSLEQAGPTRLKEAAPLLARSLAIKLDEKCLERVPQLQVPCLMEGRDSLILNDGHSTSIVEALTSGPATDLAMEASYTPQLSYGYYSPYIASVLDIARIMSSFNTAQYQYIPALATQGDDRLTLTLNTPPSFHDPKSVLVAALPAVEPAQLPPLHAVDPNEMFCARKTSLVLPVEGAPLVFASAYARGLTLRFAGKNGHSLELPAKPEPEQGGFVVDTAALSGVDLGASIHGALHGRWGFEEYNGPSFELMNTQTLTLSPAQQTALIVGREDTVHLQAVSVSCIEEVMLRDSAGKQLQAQWSKGKSSELEVKLPLEHAQPGPLTLLVTQYGASQPQPLALQAFSDAGHLDGFVIRVGDVQGTLKGSRLDQVASLLIKGAVFVPGTLSSDHASDELAMQAKEPLAAGLLKEGDSPTARVTLKDGRSFDIAASVLAPRPSVSLLTKNIEPAATANDSHIDLAASGELPHDARLTFSLRADYPATFTHDARIEVATTDGAYSTQLTFASGALTLEDARVAVATFDPAAAFGRSAFGPLQFRLLSGGVTGDWQPLVSLVRLPALKQLTCPATAELACKLSGTNLFLIEAIADNAQFAHPIQVPEGFSGYSLPVPHPSSGQLYLRLRDDPTVINTAALSAELLPPSPDEVARAAARHAAAVSLTSAPSSSAPTTTSAAPTAASGGNGTSSANPTAPEEAPHSAASGTPSAGTTVSPPDQGADRAATPAPASQPISSTPPAATARPPAATATSVASSAPSTRAASSSPAPAAAGAAPN
jgi:hypothetical protein